MPLAGHRELAESLAEISAQARPAPEPIRISNGYLTFTDAYSFTLAGAPAIAFLQISPDYALLAHSAADTLDKIDAKTLVHNTAFIAHTALGMANSPRRVGKFLDVRRDC